VATNGRRATASGGGFSLIELLIVVAIIAALVGGAVPFFQDNLAESQRTKAKEDLTIIRNAVALYEQREGKLLIGTSLLPLVGQYLQELPADPWGNAYLYEGSVGFLGTYGADALPGGTGGDQDIVYGGLERNGESFAIKPVFPRRVQYQGSWGRPEGPDAPGAFATGNKLIVTFTRPVYESAPDQLVDDLILVDPGSEFSHLMSNATTWHPDTWRSAADGFWGSEVDRLHRPELGILVVRASIGNKDKPDAFPLRPSTRFTVRHLDDDYSPTAPPGTPLTLIATYTPDADPASPLDPAVYGSGALEFHTAVFPPPDMISLDQEVRGIPIERY